ncbi:hypothetical protein [Cesiribacter sp. SM1]|uniref:hypothetical protein n=1 Tax=Cesiribacter sp. SM1 TaxID=2861196 RepID=UPI001CD2DD8E|nr:hypothetical protein [Cesiribacter sp. SM1]
MKNRIYIAFIFLLTAFAVSCDDHEMDEFTGPYRINLAGPEHVAPGDEEEYTIGDISNPESYTWTVTGPATITSGTSGNTVTLEFTEVGDVTLVVTNGRDTREYNITVENVEPAVTTTYNERSLYRGGVMDTVSLVLRNGVSDTVFFNFATPLAKDPELLMNEDISDFMSGSLGDLIKVDAQNYYAIYTAGEGNGTPRAMFRNIIATPTFGSDTLDSVMVQLYRVDNVLPVADVSYSEDLVNDSTVVTVTVNFSEEVTFSDRADSALYVTFSGAGVEAQRDTLVQSADDPLVYTYEYTVNGEGNGEVDVELDNIMDLAGHPLTLVNYESDLIVDNETPEVLLGNATAGDGAAVIIFSSDEAGTGMYLILESDDEAPEDAEAFMEMQGVASGSLNLNAVTPARTSVGLAAGEYVVYYMAQDRAGNYSDITSSTLVID